MLKDIDRKYSVIHIAGREYPVRYSLNALLCLEMMYKPLSDILKEDFKSWSTDTILQLCRAALCSCSWNKRTVGRRDLTLLATLYDTGCRVSELINLKVKDIKFDNINESQISYDTNLSFQNINMPSFPEKKKVKKKFKLSLYQLQKLALLGVGASGEVYLVQDTMTKKKLALKSVKYTEDEKTRAQLETEVKLGTLLKHENIIRIYATYFLKGRINFVMEYMDKGTLSDILKKTKKIPEKYMGIITYQVMQGLAYCQKEKKIIHRDLKPSNILVNSKGEIKIADFGVSAIVEGSWAQKKTMIGTYIYMAPERIDFDSYTINSDIWSLGIIVMECLLGYYPYIIYNNNNLPNSYWIVHELIENNPIPTLDSKIYSSELIDFIKQCLIKDNNKRPKAAVLIEHPFLQKYANDVSLKQDFMNWIKSL